MEEILHAIQDYYPDDFAHCFGCGKLNQDGHHFRTGWDGEQTVTLFKPPSEQTAIPGYVYGGMLASLVDCHGTGSAALAKHRQNGHEPGDGAAAPRFVTGSLTVNYLKPTPQRETLRAVGTIEEAGEKKVKVSVNVYAADTLVVTGSVLAVLMPETFK